MRSPSWTLNLFFAATFAATSAVAFVALAACATPMSAEEHRALAEQEEQRAADHAARYDPGARALRVTTVPDDNTPQVDAYNPTHYELDAAAGHTKSAERHRKAARALEQSEDQACVGVAPAARSACPLLFPTTVEDTPRGVRVTFASEADAERAAAVIRCQQAFAQTRAFEDLPTCALYAPGLKLEQKGAVLELAAKDEADVERLRDNIRGHHR
jgi:hypothetical protein